jgi:hypothetical protein
MKSATVPPCPGPGYVLIFRAWRRDVSGARLYARTYGYRAWPIWVRR